MAKQLWFTVTPATTHRGNNDATLAGAASWWQPYKLDEVRGASQTSGNVSTVAGPTNGLEVREPGGAYKADGFQNHCRQISQLLARSR